MFSTSSRDGFISAYIDKFWLVLSHRESVPYCGKAVRTPRSDKESPLHLCRNRAQISFSTVASLKDYTTTAVSEHLLSLDIRYERSTLSAVHVHVPIKNKKL